MPSIFINGQEVDTLGHDTVLKVALAHGFHIPHFCWHPALSVAGNCRICMVETEGGWIDIACNMPVKDGMRVETESEAVLEQRKAMLKFLLLNHPVDCGICDKAGECALQDYHYAHNGEPRAVRDAKLHQTKFFSLGQRIVLDNERCILCSRCVRFTREVSKSDVLGIVNRTDASVIRPGEGRSLDEDPYSDNVIDLCPVGALLSRDFMYQARVWYLQPTPSVCPGCARGCTVKLWTRKPEWRFKSGDPARNDRVQRVTPLENPEVNGHWICNFGRDLGHWFERPRAGEPRLKGQAVGLDEAIEAARALIGAAARPFALVSSAGSNEELEAFRAAFGDRLQARVKSDRSADDGEVVEDELLIVADKNPNGHRARALFDADPAEVPADADLVLVWGEGVEFGTLPRGAKIVFLNAWLRPEIGSADVFIPLTTQLERRGHFTNQEGVVSRFEPVRKPPPDAIDAELLFPRLATPSEVTP